MRFRVVHSTRYRYNRPVFLEPHTVRLRPRSGPSQRLIRFELQIAPRPVLLSESLGPEGDPVAYAWFEGTTDSLLVRTLFDVETLPANPFDYLLLGQQSSRLPMKYLPAQKLRLSPFLAPVTRQDDAVAQFAQSIAEAASDDTLRFLSLLNERIYEDWEVTIREEGDAHPPEYTLKAREGACRDIAMLFVECCRQQGIAARFVSGYQEGDRDTEERFMHAWAEVFLPGGGWRGYDPSHGLAVSDRHIAVAAAADPRFAAPIVGTVRGTGATSAIDAEIHVEVPEEPVSQSENPS